MSKRAWIKNQDWILWGALGCALVGTAHAEYTLATAAGVNGYVALAVPGALDLYVVRALRVRRDVLVAVLAMVAANVASHLVHSGDLTMDWRLRSAVGALAPLILWRVYSLRYGRVRTGTQQVQDPGAVSAPEVHVPEDVPATGYEDTDWDRDYLPDGWAKEYGADMPGEAVPETAPAPYPDVPALPPEYITVGTVRYNLIEDRDRDALPQFEAYLLTCEEDEARPTIRGTRDAVGCGQDKAKRLLGYAGYPQEVE